MRDNEYQGGSLRVSLIVWILCGIAMAIAIVIGW